MRAEDKKIVEFFHGSFFEVPDYQRLYAWEEKNCKDFWNDIIKSVKEEQNHYLGTITLEEKGNGKYEVIDGQQRLTTFYLFALALYCVLSEKELWKDDKDRIKFETVFLVDDIHKLILGNINKDFFKDLIDKVLSEGCSCIYTIGSPPENTNRKILNCLKFFYEKLRKIDEEDLRNIKNFLFSQDYSKCLFLVKFIVNDEKTAIKIFEVINDRGLPLSYVEKLKSHLMFVVENEKLSFARNYINVKFGEFFKYFDLIKSKGEDWGITYIKRDLREDDLLVYLYHYLARWAINKYNLESKIGYNYDANKEYIWTDFFLKIIDILRSRKNDLEEFIKNTVNDLSGLAESFYKLLDEANCNGKSYNKALFKFLVLLQPNVRTWHLLVSTKYKGFLDLNLLRMIESMDVRIYKVRGTDPRKNIYWHVISELKGANKFPFQAFCDFLKEYGNNIDFESKLSGYMYDNVVTKYILWELNNKQEIIKLAQKLNINIPMLEDYFNDCNVELYRSLQKEHIIAQNVSEDFRNIFLDEREFSEYINKLGNLTLLKEKENKDCSNEIPLKKSETCYFKSEIPYTKYIISEYITKYEKFEKEDIDRFTNLIIDFCKKRFPMCGEEAF